MVVFWLTFGCFRLFCIENIVNIVNNCLRINPSKEKGKKICNFKKNDYINNNKVIPYSSGFRMIPHKVGYTVFVYLKI